MKTPLLVVVLLAIIATGGYYGFQQYQESRAAAAKEAARKMQAASGQKQAATHPAQSTAEQAQAAAKKQAAEDATRKEVETALKGMKVTSILPGQPGIVIIDKQEYAEGDDLPVGKGRKLRVAQVLEQGVVLTGGELTYHLDPPAAPDLAAIRKAR